MLYTDLQRVNLEKPQSSRTEHYTFTLTNSSGVRYYGICMRGLFRGVSRRFDVKRRTRHCLCFITRYPFFRMFKNVLLELHAIALLEETPGCCRQFIDYFYRKCIINDFTSLKEQHILVPHSTVAALYHDVSILRHRISNSSSSTLGMSSKEVPLLPLFDSLGIERFFKLLSAVLCENRILFIADEAETLSSTVLAAVTLLHPFKWHHTFIPLLPDNLLSYISKTSPYMIGIRRYLVNELKKEYLEGVVTVDIESGEVRLHGSGTIRDIIGDSGTTLKQASESLDQMKAKMSSMFYGSAKPSGSTGGGDKKAMEHGGPKDIMLTVISDLRSMIISTKPGSTLSSMLKGGRSLEESKMQWSIESEKVIKDCLSCFFVYLFGNLEDFVIPAALLSSTIDHNNINTGGSVSSSGFGTVVTAEPPKTFVGIGNKSNIAIVGNNNDNKVMNVTSYLKAYGPDDSRSKFDLKAFVHKRIQLGDSKNIVSFVSDFINSEIFEKYCTELFQRLCSGGVGSGSNHNHNNKRQSTVEFRTAALKPTIERNVKSMPTVNTSSSSIVEVQNSDSKRLNVQQAEDPEDIFDAACIELKNREQVWSIFNVKAMVAYCSSSALQLSSDGNSSTKEMGSHFHLLTVQYTTGAIPLASFELEAEKDSAYYTGIFNSTTVITADARDVSKRVMIEHNVKKIVVDSCNSEYFVKVMTTIGFRLQSCLAATCRGASGISGIRALILCRCLLIEGPECVLSYALDFIPTLRELLMVRQMQDLSSKQQQAMDYMALGAAVDATAHSKQVLDLILDHKKLLNQRKVFVLLKNGSLSFLSQRLPTGELVATTHVKKDQQFFNENFSSKDFLSFKSLHEGMNTLKLRSVSSGVVKTTAPELASGLEESPDDDDDYEGSTSKITKKRSSIAMPPSQRSPHSPVVDDSSSKSNCSSEAVSLIQSTSASTSLSSSTTTTVNTSATANTSAAVTTNNAYPKPSKPAKPTKNVKLTPVSSTDSLVNVVDADPFQSRSTTTTTLVTNSTTSSDSFAPFYDRLSSGTTTTTSSTSASTSDPFASDPFGSTAVLSHTSTIPMHHPVGTNTTTFISTTRPPGSTYVRPVDGKVESKDPFASLNPMLG